MSFLPMVLMGVSAAVGVAGQLQQGRAEAETAKYNAKVAGLQATQVRRASEFEQYKLQRAKKQTLASQRARFLASGVSLEGSPMEVMIDTATQFELDLAAEKYNTASQISNLRMEQAQYKRAGQSALTSSYLAAGGTILKGAASMYAMKPVKTPTPSTSSYTGMGSLSYGTGGYKPKSKWSY